MSQNVDLGVGLTHVQQEMTELAITVREAVQNPQTQMKLLEQEVAAEPVAEQQRHFIISLRRSSKVRVLLA